MSESPLVSVVMPFLRAVRFLAESVASVRAQTYPHWELLLCDDGSTDGSAALARQLAAEDPARIRVLAHPDGATHGASAARNLGLAAARGAYVAFLDADDVWLPPKLAEQVALLEARPEADALTGSTEFWHGWTGQPADAARDHVVRIGPPDGTLLRAPAMLVAMLDGTAAVPCTCSLVVRRAAAERAGGFEASFRRVFTDQAFYAKLFADSSLLVVDACWDRYRQHDASACVSAGQSGELATTRVQYLEWLGRHLDARGLRDRAVRRALAGALRRARTPDAVPLRARLRRRLRTLRRGTRRAWQAGAALLGGSPPTGMVRFGHLRRTTPINRHWGWERGQPVDRHYIEAFLARHAADVRGRVLEVGDDSYTRRYGGDRVTRRDVLHAHPGNPIATFVADLASADHLPSDAFDCIILTQTLHLVFDMRAAMRTLHRILAPDGTLLVTVPGISQTTDDSWRDSWYWSLTVPALARLAGECFPADRVEVASHGNVLTAVAFLHGLAREELRADELAAVDRDFPLVVTLRARKPPAAT